MISDDILGQVFERELAELPKRLTSDLYHYTSSDAAILGILANGTVRMSPFSGTNDLWESTPIRPNLEGGVAGDDDGVLDAFGVWEDVDRYIRGYSKVACFTQDWELPDSAMNRDALRGWSHLALWAHYGGKHAGVCLRFDRDRLVASFEAARGEAVHQFHGPVEYRSAEYGIGPYGISLEQASEFGVDAVALHYANRHRARVFFRKHADWASESEYRLVRTDLTTEPHYVDIADSLTGVVIGDSFPSERLPALFKMLSGYESVEVVRASFSNRVFRLFPVEGPSLEQAERRGIPPRSATIEPRRVGSLADRLNSLEEAELAAEKDQSAAEKYAAPIAQIWEGEALRLVESLADWPGVIFNRHPGSAAIPDRERRKAPGVPGEVFSCEAGFMIVGENQPQDSFTIVIAAALQTTATGATRLHACIRAEEWADGGNNQQELYRDRRDVEPDELLEAQSQLLERLLYAVQGARKEFDLLRNYLKE